MIINHRIVRRKLFTLQVSPRYDYTIRTIVLFCSLAVLDPRFDHTMGVLSPFILV